MNIYLTLAESVLVIHLLFILWVIGGVLVVRWYPSLQWIHIGSLVYSIVIEVVPWPPCPLTILEQKLEDQAGIVAYHGSFLLHYLDVLVYPNLPLTLLVCIAVGFCAANLAYYACHSRIECHLRRRRQRQESGGTPCQSDVRVD